MFGAQAVILNGVPRLSADVDVTLALEPDAPDRFVVDMTAAWAERYRRLLAKAARVDSVASCSHD